MTIGSQIYKIYILRNCVGSESKNKNLFYKTQQNDVTYEYR
jgi:hypothetical protein